VVRRVWLGWVLVFAVAAFAGGAGAQSQPKSEGIESEGYVWNEWVGEKAEALELEADIERGEEAYEICSACHLPSGAGRPDGTFPQLAGQHRGVIIKQIADIREGRRDNPIMYPFAKTLTDSQELADVASYIETLAIPTDNGRGPGDDLDLGQKLYEENCVECHGNFGEGDARRFYPVLAGQHYKYMLRQVTEIRDGKRRNANPDMVTIVKKYSDQDLAAVVDYMSRLEWPHRQGPASVPGSEPGSEK
jgi:cytochrome c553